MNTLEDSLLLMDELGISDLCLTTSCHHFHFFSLPQNLFFIQTFLILAVLFTNFSTLHFHIQ